MNVLIVDDEPILANLMQRALEREGWSVIIAHSLAAAQRQLGPFDVVIADVRLQNGDGRHLKEMHPHTPFISISGHPGELPDLPKPFGPRELRAKVLEAVKQRST